MEKRSNVGKKSRFSDRKLYHLSIGKVKNLNRNDWREFEITNISWNVHWQMSLFLAVIIRDYLRFFIKNTPVIGDCAFDDTSKILDCTDEECKAASQKWKGLVNSVADEFDELARHYRGDFDDVDVKSREEKRSELVKKAFADLAFIFDELSW